MALPFKIHELLSAAELAELEAYCREPGRTVDEAHEWMQARGFTLSRGAVGNWLCEFKKQLMAERFSRSGELAAAIKAAVAGGEFEKVADAAVMQLTQVVFEQSTALESDGEVDPLDVMRMTRSLKNLVGSQAEMRRMLAEKFDREMSKATKGGAISAGDIASVRKAVFG